VVESMKVNEYEQTNKNKHLNLDYLSPANLLLTVLLIPLELVFIRLLE
jgi:hypothetical protein